MRKLLLLSSFVALCSMLSAQTSQRVTVNKVKQYKDQGAVVINNQNQTRFKTERGLSNAGKLNSQKIGTAGNLLTIIEGTCNQLDVNDSLNTVTFIHRNDQSIYIGTNVAMYRYDISKDRGNTWVNDLGPITNDPTIDNVNVNGRFPQGAIYNPVGNTNADSAYLIYSGTWHDNNTWSGQMRGRGMLSGDTSTFNVHIDPVNNKHVAIAAGFCPGEPGVFWNVNRDYSGTFTAGSNSLTNFIIIQKGVWNSTTGDMDWTETNINQAFTTLEDANGALFSGLFSLNMAFDPTGQYGWVAALADITQDNDSVFDPVFWRTIDGGANWTGPIRVDLDSLVDVVAQLGPQIINGSPASGIPTSWTDGDIVVDYEGNPHFLITVGNGGGYAIQYAGFDVWDITYTANPTACTGNNWNGWRGVYIDSIRTLSGTMTNDATPLTENNRPLASRSSDGKHLFFFWNESDFDLIGGPDNDIPNLFTRAFDLEHFTSTKAINLTEGDSLWGGETMTTPGGIFGGAIYPTVSPVALKNGTSFNVPLVLTQVDYNHDPLDGLGNSEQPAAFWYVNNIDFDKGDFTEGLAADVTINGDASITMTAGQPYTEDSATITYLDTLCFPSGELHLEIDYNGFDPNTGGTYTIYYLAVDANGNVYASDVRTVFVGAAPVADFSWNFPVIPNRAQFVDQSVNSPTTWLWNFGDGSPLSGVQNPVHQYSAVGSYNVCLTSSNQFGSSAQVCKSVDITQVVGINEVDFANMINVYPNPTAGKVSIAIEGVNEDLTVTVYSTLGEVVVNPTIFKSGNSIVDLDLAGLSNGVYFIKLQTEKGTAVKNLTITK